MSEPVLVAVDDVVDALREIERELDDRYGRHSRVVCLWSAHEIGNQCIA
jgi:hypothetical protein